MSAQRIFSSIFNFFKSPTKVFFAFFLVYFLLFSLSLPVLAQSFSGQGSVISNAGEKSPTNVGISNQLRDPSPMAQDDKFLSQSNLTPKPQTLNPNYTPLPNYIPPGSPQHTQLQVYNIFHTASCIMVGFSYFGQKCIEFTPVKNLQGMVSQIPVLSSVNPNGGLLGGMASLIGGLYQNKPLSSAAYLASL